MKDKLEGQLGVASTFYLTRKLEVWQERVVEEKGWLVNNGKGGIQVTYSEKI